MGDGAEALNSFQTESYDINAAQEILRLAGEARLRMDRFCIDDLVRAAGELDIPESAVLEAEQLVKENLSEADDRAEFRRAKRKETFVHFLMFTPILFLLLVGHFFAHSFSGVAANAVGTLKTFLNSLTAVVFGRATQHEIEFRQWRSKRMHVAEYGATNPAEIVRWYFLRHPRAPSSEVVRWLSEENGVAKVDAQKAVSDYKKFHPHAFLPEGL